MHGMALSSVSPIRWYRCVSGCPNLSRLSTEQDGRSSQATHDDTDSETYFAYLLGLLSKALLHISAQKW